MYALLFGVRGICSNTYKIDALMLLSCNYCLSTMSKTLLRMFGDAKSLIFYIFEISEAITSLLLSFNIAYRYYCADYSSKIFTSNIIGFISLLRTLLEEL